MTQACDSILPSHMTFDRIQFAVSIPMSLKFGRGHAVSTKVGYAQNIDIQRMQADNFYASFCVRHSCDEDLYISLLS